MTNFVEYLTDVIGNNYLGVKMPEGVIDKHLTQLKGILSEEDYVKFTDNQKKRDNGYHLTVMSVAEFNGITKKMGMDKFVSSLQQIFKYEIDDLKMLGVGTAKKSTNQTYFVVCQSDKLDAVRDFYGLDEKDFHVTIGFHWKDVFGVRKNVVLDEKSLFLDTLKQEYMNKKNFDFVKSISNYDMDKNAQIIPVTLDDNHLKVKCDGYFLVLSYIESTNELRITNKFEIEGQGPNRLTQFEIDKIFSL